MNEEKRISVVINTRNAAQYLQEVIDAVQGFDEVLICDMESEDETLDIARRNHCRVVTFPKADHKSAEPARTFAIQQAQGPWVLVVDADEIVTPELRDYLYRRIEEPDCPAGLYIPRWNRFMLRYTKSLSYDRQLRFFRKEGTVWPPYVHHGEDSCPGEEREVRPSGRRDHQRLGAQDECLHRRRVAEAQRKALRAWGADRAPSMAILP